MPLVVGLNGGEEVIQAGELLVLPAQYTASARGQVIPLSRRELDLLTVLARNAGRVIPRAALYEQVWGAPLRSADRSVDVYVHKLRTKLSRVLPEWHYIHTHFGFGYRFQPERSQHFHKSATTR